MHTWLAWIGEERGGKRASSHVRNTCTRSIDNNNKTPRHARMQATNTKTQHMRRRTRRRITTTTRQREHCEREKKKRERERKLERKSINKPANQSTSKRKKFACFLFRLYIVCLLARTRASMHVCVRLFSANLAIIIYSEYLHVSEWVRLLACFSFFILAFFYFCFCFFFLFVYVYKC